MSTRRPVRASLVDRCIVAAYATLAALALGEWWARRVVDTKPRDVESSSLLGWNSREYAELTKQTLPPKPDGRKRLLVLGDSYLSELYVKGKQDQRFPAQWSKRFGTELEVLMLASAGWGPDQELLAYLQKGRAFQADRVLLCLCLNNDLLNLISNRQGRYASKPYFRLPHWPLEFQAGVARSAPVGPHDLALEFHRADGRRIDLASISAESPGSQRSPSALVEAVRLVYSRRAAPSSPDARYSQWEGFELGWEGILADPDGRTERRPQAEPDLANAYVLEATEWTEYQWTLLEALLAEFRRIVAADGAHFTCLLLPMALTQHDPQWIMGTGRLKRLETPLGPLTLDMNAPARRMAALCARQGLELLDPTVEFAAMANSPGHHQRLWPPDSNLHWSAAGHDWLAEHLKSWVTDLVRGK